MTNRRRWVAVAVAGALAAGVGIVAGTYDGRPVAGVAALSTAHEIDTIDYPVKPRVGVEIRPRGSVEDHYLEPVSIGDDVIIAVEYDNAAESTGTVVRGFERRTGAPLWEAGSTELAGHPADEWYTTCAGYVDSQTTICVTSGYEESDGPAVVTVVDLRSGQVIRRSPVDLVDHYEVSTVFSEAAFPPGTVIISHGTADRDDGFGLTVVDTTTGEAVWSRSDFPGDYWGLPIMLFSATSLSVPVKTDRPGGEINDEGWYSQFDTLVVDPANGEDRIELEGPSYSLDGDSWIGYLDSQAWSGTAIRGVDGFSAWSVAEVDLTWNPWTLLRQFVLGTEGAAATEDAPGNLVLVALDARDGARLWERPVREVPEDSRTVGDLLVLSDAIVDWRTGKQLGRSYGDLVGVGPGLIYTTDGSSVRALRRDDLSVAWRIDLDDYLQPDPEDDDVEDGSEEDLADVQAWVLDGRIVLGGDAGFVVLDPATGNPDY